VATALASSVLPVASATNRRIVHDSCMHAAHV
jgi:hypothetical protein